MEESIPFRHEWIISGLSSVCHRITGHPYIQSIDRRLSFDFHPNGYDESCGEYVSFWIGNCEQRKYCFLECKISIKNSKTENLFVKEWKMKWRDYNILKEYIKRDYLLDPANGLTYNDQFTLCVEGWLHNREVNDLSNLENIAEWTRDYFDFRPLLSTKLLALKWTIENVLNFFEKSNKPSIELPEIKNSTETGEVIFRSRIELIKNLNNNKMMFELKTDNKMPIVVETSLIDINQQKCYREKTVSIYTILNGIIRYFNIDEEIYSRESIFADSKLTLLCEITIIPESIKEKNEINYSQILRCFEVPSALQITECTIDGETGEILQNKVVPKDGIEKLEQEKIERENLEQKKLEPEKLEQENLEQEKLEKENLELEKQAIEKLKQFSTKITKQKLTIDQKIITVNNIYHEHYFENANINDSFVNAKSQSNFEDINIKSEHSDCTELIEKLQAIVSNEIKPVLDQNEQMYTELKSSTEDLFVEVLSKQEEMKEELINETKEIKNELNKLKQFKKMKQSKMKKIVDKIIALLNRIKFQLNKVGTKVIIKVEQVRQSKRSPPKSPEPTLIKPNFITEYIEPHISSLIEYVQSVTTSQSNSTETKQSHIHKLETVKTFLIAHLSTENCSTINPNAHFEIDSITLENAEHKLADIIDNHRSDWDKKLLNKLCDLIVEAKAESCTVLSDNAEDTEDSK